MPTADAAKRWGLDGALADELPLVVAIKRPGNCDDGIIPIIGRAQQLAGKVARAETIAQSSSSRFGMSINFKKRKTETAMRFRRTGAEAARGAAIVTNKSVICCVSDIGFPFDLRIVPTYKHQ